MGGPGVRTPPVKSPVAICSLRKTGTDSPRETVGPIGWVHLFIQPSMKYVDSQKKIGKFSGSAHVIP